MSLKPTVPVLRLHLRRNLRLPWMLYKSTSVILMPWEMVAQPPIPNGIQWAAPAALLAPATVEDHATLGATWAIDKQSEVTFHYMHAFKNEIKGKGSTPEVIHPIFKLGEANIKMHQDSFGIGYSRKF